MSESLYGALIVAVLLAAYAYLDARTVRRVAVLGALIALAALTRGEALLLVPLLGLALVARGTLPARERLVHLAVLVAPSRSCSRRGRSATRRPSTRPCSSPPTARASGSAPTAIRPTTGRSSACGTSPATARRRRGDEAQQSREYRRRGMQYMRDHAGRVPAGPRPRASGACTTSSGPAQMRVYEASEGRAGALGAPRRVAVLAAGAARRRGAWLLRRRRQPLAILLAPGGHGHAHRAADLRLHALSLRRRAVDRRARGGGRRRARGAGAGARRERPARFPRGELRARTVRGTRGQRGRARARRPARPGAGADRHALLGPEAIGLYGVVVDDRDDDRRAQARRHRRGVRRSRRRPTRRREFQRAFTLELVLSARLRARAARALAPVLAAVYDDDRLLALTLAVAYLPLAFALQAPLWVFFRRMDYARQRSLQAIVPLVTVRGHGPAGCAAGVACGRSSSARSPATWRRVAGARWRCRPTALRLRFDRDVARALPALLVAGLRRARRGAGRRPGPDPRLRARRRAGRGGLHHAGGDADALRRPRRPDRHRDDLPGDLRDPRPHARRSRSCSCRSNRATLLWALPVRRGRRAVRPRPRRLRRSATSGGRRVVLLRGLAVADRVGQLGFNWFSFYRAHGESRPPAVEARGRRRWPSCALAVPGLAARGRRRASSSGAAPRSLCSSACARATSARCCPACALRRPAGAALPCRWPRARRGVLALRAALWGGQAGSQAQAVAELALFGAVVVVLSLRLERGLHRRAVGAVRRAGPAEQEPGEGDRDEGDGGHLPVPVQAGVQGPGRARRRRGRRPGPRSARRTRRRRQRDRRPARAASSARPTSPRSASVSSSSEWASRTRSSIVRRRSHSTAKAAGAGAGDADGRRRRRARRASS